MISQTGGILLSSQNRIPDGQDTALLHCVVYGPHIALLSYQLEHHTWNTVMIAAGKVSKLAEGVPSLKLNLKRKFRENKNTSYQVPQLHIAVFIISFLFSPHLPLPTALYPICSMKMVIPISEKKNWWALKGTSHKTEFGLVRNDEAPSWSFHGEFQKDRSSNRNPFQYM